MKKDLNEIVVKIIDTYGFPLVIDSLNISHYDKIQLLKEMIISYLYDSASKHERIEWWRLVFENGKMYFDGELVFSI